MASVKLVRQFADGSVAIARVKGAESTPDALTVLAGEACRALASILGECEDVKAVTDGMEPED